MTRSVQRSWRASNDCIFIYRHASYVGSRYWFWQRLSVCLSVNTKSRKLLIGNWCNLVRICPMVNARSDWKLVTFDLERHFVFLVQAVIFEWLVVAALYSVCRYIFRIFRSRSIFKVMGSRSRSWQRKSVACKAITTGQKLLGLDRNIG